MALDLLHPSSALAARGHFLVAAHGGALCFQTDAWGEGEELTCCLKEATRGKQIQRKSLYFSATIREGWGQCDLQWCAEWQRGWAVGLSNCLNLIANTCWWVPSSWTSGLGNFFLSAPCSSELRQIRSSKHHADQTFSSWRLFVFSPPAWFLLLLPQPLPVLQDYSEMHASDVGNHPRDPAPDKHSVSNHFIFLPFLPAWSFRKKEKKKKEKKVKAKVIHFILFSSCRIISLKNCFVLLKHETETASPGIS